MKFTISWLKEHLISNFTDEKILNKLTDIGLEVESFENQKSELGFYFSTKVYEERHPVDNSFFMSQDGWMIGVDSNSETYSDLYTGFKTRLAYGQVDYTSNGTGTMAGVSDYQFETTGYLGIPFEGSNSRTTLF